MIYPLVLDLAAAGIPVAVTCRVLGFSKQGFYQWRASPVSARDVDEAYLLNAAYDIHADDPEFGHRFIADELQAAGHAVSERRVWRPCSQQRLLTATVRKKKRYGRPAAPVGDELLERDFTAGTLNATWLTYITEHHTGEGKVYMRALRDASSARIVGYAIDACMTSDLAVAALRDAVARRAGTAAGAGCIVHSDRGSNVVSGSFSGP